jgi:putative inorganic carbon (HCO3(-)) transporter
MAIFALVFSKWLSPFAFINVFKTFLPLSLPARLGVIGNVVNANELAGVLAWILPLFLATLAGFWRAIWRSGRWSMRFSLFILGGMLLFNTILLLGTRSRGAYLGVLVAILVMMAIRYRWGKWLLILALIAGILLAYSIGLGDLLGGGSSTLQELGLQGRLEIWSRALYGISDFPITGMSMNGFRVLVQVLYPLFTIAPNLDIGHAHNHLLQAALDLGALGLIAYLSIWLLSALLLWRSWKDLKDGADRVVIIGLSGSFIAGWIFGILDAIALGAKPGFLWWLLLALLVSIFLKRKKSQDIVSKNVIISEP